MSWFLVICFRWAELQSHVYHTNEKKGTAWNN